MYGAGHQPAGMAASQRQGLVQRPFRQMHAVRFRDLGQVRIETDQQSHAPRRRHLAQPFGHRPGIGGPEGAIDDRRAGRQGRRRQPRLRGPDRVGEEQQGRPGGVTADTGDGAG